MLDGCSDVNDAVIGGGWCCLLPRGALCLGLLLLLVRLGVHQLSTVDGGPGHPLQLVLRLQLHQVLDDAVVHSPVQGGLDGHQLLLLNAVGHSALLLSVLLSCCHHHHHQLPTLVRSIVDGCHLMALLLDHLTFCGYLNLTPTFDDLYLVSDIDLVC